MWFVSGPDKRRWFFQSNNAFFAVLAAIHIYNEAHVVSMSRKRGVGVVYHKVIR